LQRVCEDTEIALTKLTFDLEKIEKERVFVERAGDALLEKRSQEFGARLRSKEDMEAEARDELKRL